MSLGTLIFAAVSFGLGSSAAASLGAYTVSTAVASGMSEGAAGSAGRRRQRRRASRAACWSAIGPISVEAASSTW